MSRFWVTIQFSESAPNDPKWPWHVQGQIYQHACFIHPQRPKFSSVWLYDEPFLSYGPIFWNCTEWPQMTLTCSRLKIPACRLHTPPRPKLSSLSLYDEPFLSYGPIFWKVHRMTPNDLDMCKVKNTNMHVIYIPHIRPFRSTMSRFWVTGQFSKSGPNVPKWPWYVQGKKYQHACYIHPRGQNFRPFRSVMSRFWVTGQFSEKCTKWPIMTLTSSRSKIPTCMLHKPPGPKFLSSLLYDEPFSRKLRFLNSSFNLVKM